MMKSGDCVVKHPGTHATGMSMVVCTRLSKGFLSNTVAPHWRNSYLPILNSITCVLDYVCVCVCITLIYIFL